VRTTVDKVAVFDGAAPGCAPNAAENVDVEMNMSDHEINVFLKDETETSTAEEDAVEASTTEEGVTEKYTTEEDVTEEDVSEDHVTQNSKFVVKMAASDDDELQRDGSLEIALIAIAFVAGIMTASLSLIVYRSFKSKTRSYRVNTTRYDLQLMSRHESELTTASDEFLKSKV